jgi:hypothetical protein
MDTEVGDHSHFVHGSILAIDELRLRLFASQLAEYESFGEGPIAFKRRDRNVESLGRFLFSKAAQKSRFDNIGGNLAIARLTRARTRSTARTLPRSTASGRKVLGGE